MLSQWPPSCNQRLSRVIHAELRPSARRQSLAHADIKSKIQAVAVAVAAGTVTQPNKRPTLGNINSNVVAATISPAWRTFECLNMTIAFIVVFLAQDASGP